jgi:hypothetical protein
MTTVTLVYSDKFSAPVGSEHGLSTIAAEIGAHKHII